MSDDGFEDIITTDDILEVLDEMGLEMCNQDDLDKLIGAVMEIEMSSVDDSLFMGGVETTPATQEMSMYQSPLRPKSKKVLPNDTARSTYFSARQTLRNAEDQQLSTNPEADFWIAKAYDRMAYIYDSIREMDDLFKNVDQLRPTHDDLNVVEGTSELEKENLPTIPPLSLRSDRSNAASVLMARSEGSCTSRNTAVSGSTTVGPKTVSHAVQSIRPITNPDPGRLGYRYDPVKRWELAREQWARMPPPHEKKRLELRWKVREYMLRKEQPTYDPRQTSSGRPVIHTKGWSPKPYLP